MSEMYGDRADLAHLYHVPDVEIPTERDKTKPCRPIYCAKHYDNVTDAECARAYQCPGVEEL